MIKTWSLALMVLVLPFSQTYANCDLTQFRWECDVPLHVKPTRSAPALVYCGNTQVYVSQRDYDTLVRYQRANVNMILTVNGEYMDSPCIPDQR